MCFILSLIKITEHLHTLHFHTLHFRLLDHRKPSFSEISKPKTLTSEMATSTSSVSTSEFSFPKDLPINIVNCTEVFCMEKSLEMKGKSFNLVMEQPVDFEGLRLNQHDIEKFFTDQDGGFRYMRVLNGPIYPTLVKDFWFRSKVVTVEDYVKELTTLRNSKSENKNKTPAELGLREVKEDEVRSVVCGFEVVLTQSNLASMLYIPNEGKFHAYSATEAKSTGCLKDMTRRCYEQGKSCESNKSGDLKPTQKLLAKILLGSIFPRSGSSDQLSWDHRYFIYFLTRGYQLNLAKYIFCHMCKAVNSKPNVHIIYPRILSEIFYQCSIIYVIKAAGQDHLLRELRASVISRSTLSNMYF